MPAQGVATIVVALVLALALVGAVAVVLVQLLRTSRTLAGADEMLAGLPRALSPLESTIGRINRALGSL